MMTHSHFLTIADFSFIVKIYVVRQPRSMWINGKHRYVVRVRHRSRHSQKPRVSRVCSKIFTKSPHINLLNEFTRMPQLISTAMLDCKT